jgi:hypothetical protein
MSHRKALRCALSVALGRGQPDAKAESLPPVAASRCVDAQCGSTPTDCVDPHCRFVRPAVRDGTDEGGRLTSTQPSFHSCPFGWEGQAAERVSTSGWPSSDERQDWCITPDATMHDSPRRLAVNQPVPFVCCRKSKLFIALEGNCSESDGLAVRGHHARFRPISPLRIPALLRLREDWPHLPSPVCLPAASILTLSCARIESHNSLPSLRLCILSPTSCATNFESKCGNSALLGRGTTQPPGHSPKGRPSLPPLVLPGSVQPIATTDEGHWPRNPTRCSRPCPQNPMRRHGDCR